MYDKVLEAIKQHKLIDEKDVIVIGLSGGPDSVCLLHILTTIRCSMGIEIIAVHVNHMLRGEESDEDETYVKELCDRLEVPLKVFKIDISKISKERGLSLEEAGREERYKLFDLIANSVAANKIAVAHNKNDQAETVLMNIIRGTGLDGLRGMDFSREKIIRPLLGIEREEIEKYCIKHGLNPRTDSSNLECVYTRNRIRLNLIPYIQKLFNIDIVHNINKMSGLLKDDSDYIEHCMNGLLSKSLAGSENGEVLLNLKFLNNCHIAAKKRIIRKFIKQVKGNIRGIENIHIENVIDMIENGRVSTELHLPGGIRVSRSYNTLKIYTYSKEPCLVDFSIRINIPGKTIITELGKYIEASVIDDFSLEELGSANNNNSSTTQFFDYELVCKGINLRRRRVGDIFKPFRSSGTKKLKEYFIDSKIPKEDRDRIPLVTLESEVIWIIGYKISDKFKLTENTKRVLKLEFH